MKIYPKDTFEIDSTLSAGEVYSSISAVVEPSKQFRLWSSSGKKFQGECTYSNFKIRRIISYSNSFLPIIEGNITPTVSGSRIVITMRLHRFVAAFMLFWLGGFSIGLAAFPVTVMGPLPGILIPLGMLLGGIAMASGGFWWEAKKTKLYLFEILKGIERQPTRE